MKLALLSAFLFDDSIGGAENHIRFMAREFVSLGHEVLIFKPVFEDGTTPERCIIEGLPVVKVPLGRERIRLRRMSGRAGGRLFEVWRKLSFSSGCFGLAKAVRDFDPDLVWQHDFSSSWCASRLLARHYPCVLTNHQGQYIVLSRTAAGRLALRLSLAHYAGVIGPSSELTPAWHLNSKTIYNGVDVKVFRPLEPPLREATRVGLLGWNDDFVLLCPRRWAPSKGVLCFVEALLQLEETHPNLTKRLRVAFAGDAYSEYPRYADAVRRQLAFLRNIRYECLGMMDVYELVPYYQCADMVVIPSMMEAVSLSALESMACDTPVLATKVGGMAELLRHGDTGLLVPPGDAKALATELAHWLEDPGSLRHVGKRGGEMVRDGYSWASIAVQTEEFLAKLIPTKRSSDRPTKGESCSGSERANFEPSATGERSDGRTNGSLDLK